MFDVRTVMQHSQLGDWLAVKGLSHLKGQFIEARYTDVSMIEEEGLFDEDLDAIGVTDPLERATLRGKELEDLTVEGKDKLDEGDPATSADVTSVQMNELGVEDGANGEVQDESNRTPERQPSHAPPPSPPSKRRDNDHDDEQH